MENGAPEAALDRLHTLKVRYGRELCASVGETRDKKTPLHPEQDDGSTVPRRCSSSTTSPRPCDSCGRWRSGSRPRREPRPRRGWTRSTGTTTSRFDIPAAGEFGHTPGGACPHARTLSSSQCAAWPSHPTSSSAMSRPLSTHRAPPASAWRHQHGARLEHRADHAAQRDEVLGPECCDGTGQAVQEGSFVNPSESGSWDAFL